MVRCPLVWIICVRRQSPSDRLLRTAVRTSIIIYIATRSGASAPRSLSRTAAVCQCADGRRRHDEIAAQTEELRTSNRPVQRPAIYIIPVDQTTGPPFAWLSRSTRRLHLSSVCWSAWSEFDAEPPARNRIYRMRSSSACESAEYCVTVIVVLQYEIALNVNMTLSSPRFYYCLWRLFESICDF